MRFFTLTLLLVLLLTFLVEARSVKLRRRDGRHHGSHGHGSRGGHQGSGSHGSSDSDDSSGSGESSGSDDNSGSDESSGSTGSTGSTVNNGTEASGASYSGKATWFIPSKEGGSMGACGEFEADDAFIVAMNADQYGSMSKKSSWCFKRIRIYSGDRQVDATVTDACPECNHGDLDLTQPVFEKLGDLDTGILKITWQEI